MTEEATIESVEPTARLYTVGQITFATFGASPLAGCLLLAFNYRVLQKPSAAWQSLVWGLVSAIVLFAIAFVLPERFPTMVLPVAYSIGMRQLVSYLQGDAIAKHLASGGKKGSWWVTVGLSLAMLVVIVVIVFAVILLYSLFS
jgi:hypothetical protein